MLFSGSIRENLSFGLKDGEFTEDDIRAAVDTAQAAEFVDKSEGGLDYTLAQAGKNLSGGQKQRLSIARALARTPEVLIFDDSFSALDYRTDADLRAALAKNFADAVRVIVAQRIGTIRSAEQILVLDDGRPDVVLPRDGEALMVITRLRDEAHRFAITYHRSLREKTIRESALDEVPGIGEAKKVKLLKAFGSVRGIARATEEEIASAAGVGRAIAAEVLHAARNAAGE